MTLGTRNYAAKDKGNDKEKEKENLSFHAKFASELININKAVVNGNFSEAYNTLDYLARATRGPQYTDEDRSFVRGKLLQILTLQYKERIIRTYKTKLEQFRAQNDNGLVISRIAEGYPKETGKTNAEYIEAYYKSKAIEEISSETRRVRYGGYMHTIIARVLEEYEEELHEKELQDKEEAARNAANSSMPKVSVTKPSTKVKTALTDFLDRTEER